jgi:hypothetical protein
MNISALNDLSKKQLDAIGKMLEEAESTGFKKGAKSERKLGNLLFSIATASVLVGIASGLGVLLVDKAKAPWPAPEPLEAPAYVGDPTTGWALHHKGVDDIYYFVLEVGSMTCLGRSPWNTGGDFKYLGCVGEPSVLLPADTGVVPEEPRPFVIKLNDALDALDD